MKLCGFDIGLDQPFFLIAGPCVVESEQLQMDVAGQLKEITASLGIPFIFKSSYDKANRSSGGSFRGPGMDKGLEILAKVKRELNLPVLTAGGPLAFTRLWLWQRKVIGWRTPAEFAATFPPRRALALRQMTGSAPTPDITVRQDKANAGNELKTG